VFSRTNADILNTIVAEFAESLLALEDFDSKIFEHNRIEELFKSSTEAFEQASARSFGAFSRPEPGIILLPSLVVVGEGRGDFHIEENLLSPFRFPVNLVFPSAMESLCRLLMPSEEQQSLFIGGEIALREYIRDALITIQESLLIPSRIQQSDQTLTLMTTAEEVLEGRLAVSEINVPADFQISIPRLMATEEGRQQTQPMTITPEKPSTTNTFNITINVGDSSGEHDRHALGQEIMKILIDEARKHGIQLNNS
jgi:hypothetical protein